MTKDFHTNQIETFDLSRQALNPILFVFSKLDREWSKEIN